jgi:hypothetical protein
MSTDFLKRSAIRTKGGKKEEERKVKKKLRA